MAEESEDPHTNDGDDDTEEDRLNVLLDKLTLECLDLIEQEVECKVNIEKRMSEGNLLAAKARYIQGIHTVSTAQLPTADSKEFNALVTIKENQDKAWGVQLEMEKHPVDKSIGFFDPLRWFGILVPRSLPLARERFDKSLNYVVECANIQIRLKTVMNCISHISKKLKNGDSQENNKEK